MITLDGPRQLTELPSCPPHHRWYSARIPKRPDSLLAARPSMVRIGVALFFVCFAAVSAVCEPLTLISSHTLMLPFGIEGGAVSPDGRWFAAQGSGHAGLIVAHI